ncbi:MULTISPECIES: ANR family transcriptional regulator [Serratia]|uniref:ANR family transcriptional regulator n=1 Tax=Serratia TaxID=613 RepID=UPI0013ECBC88|nr:MULTISPECIES: ANR family transcriptional regulator [Serratia]
MSNEITNTGFVKSLPSLSLIDIKSEEMKVPRLTQETKKSKLMRPGRRSEIINELKVHKFLIDASTEKYMQIAVEAVQHEKNKKFYLAIILWRKAESLAVKSVNREWASVRAKNCEKRYYLLLSN